MQWYEIAICVAMGSILFGVVVLHEMRHLFEESDYDRWQRYIAEARAMMPAPKPQPKAPPKRKPKEVREAEAKRRRMRRVVKATVNDNSNVWPLN
jgi:hypothetical protein